MMMMMRGRGATSRRRKHLNKGVLFMRSTYSLDRQMAGLSVYTMWWKQPTVGMIYVRTNDLTSRDKKMKCLAAWSIISNNRYTFF